MSFKPFEYGDEGPTNPGLGRHRLSLCRRPESKGRVYIVFVLNFSDFLHTCSSIHTSRHTHKDEVVFFLKALPGSKK